MRVYVVEITGKGGMIHYDYQLCRALQRAGVDTTLVTSTVYELHHLPHEFKVADVLRLWDPHGKKSGNKIIRFAQRALRGFQAVVGLLHLTLYLRLKKPDVVLFGAVRWAMESYFLRLMRVSGLTLADIVHDVQDFDTSKASQNLVRESQQHMKQYNTIYRQFSALFVHSQSNYDLFLKLYDVPQDKVHLIEHATSELMLETPQSSTPDEMRSRLNIAPGQPVVLFFGTLSKYKGIDELVNAFPAVQKASNARLVVAGYPAKDVDADGLKGRAAELGLNVSWMLDYVPNDQVATLMAISDVVVYPYRAITQSGALQVAYACGKPVVVTRVGGLPDVVEDGKSGLVVPPMDSDALAKAIIAVVSDPDKARQMGARARELAETRYSWRTVAETMKPVFEQIVRQRK